MKRTNTAVWVEKYNRWQIKVQKDGERKTFYSSTPGRNGQREANRKADQWLDEGIENANIRCDSVLNDFDENIKIRTSHANYDVEHRRIESYIRPMIKNVKVSVLNDAIYQSIIDKYSKRLAKKSLQNIRATLFAFAKYCRKNNFTTYYPDDVSIPKNARVEEKKILQPDDLRVLFSVDTTVMFNERVPEPYINAFRFQILTGLRPGELFGLMWPDVINGYVCIRRSINNDDEITGGKNANAIRSFKLTEDAQSVLDSQPHISPYVFPVTCVDNYRNHLHAYCISNGITDVTPYELRHTFVSVAKVLPEGLVKSLVGHSRSMDTFGIYGHELSGDSDMAADEIQSAFAKIINKKTAISG